jgi:hypothetical protein
MTVAGSSRVAWRKSSYSGANGDCVQVAQLRSDVVAVRDSNDTHGPQLAFSPSQWQAFTRTVKRAGR